MFEGLQENPHKRLVEMYHAGTPQKVKNAILEKMTSSENCLRVLICTSAFGMGVDCKDVNRIIHFGPAKPIEAYLQECGRGGRDGKQSTCYLLYNGLLYGHCQDDIKKFIVSDECRRKKMHEISPGRRNSSSVECACCDVCLKKCHCERVSTKRGLHHLAYHLAYLWLTVGLPLAYCWLTFGSLLAYLWPIAGLPSLHMVHL